MHWSCCSRTLAPRTMPDVPTRSGPNLTEARRAELGQRRLQLRICAASLERLDALCRDSGFTRSEQVEALIDCEVDWGPQKPA